MKASPLLRFAGAMPDALWKPTGGDVCLLPYYHIVSDAPVPHVSPLYRFRSIAEFQADLDFLLQHRRAISLTEFLAATAANGAPPSRSFLLTFDDGFREMHDVVAPILKARGVPAVFFLNSATVDNTQMCHHQEISLLLHTRAQPGTQFPEDEVLRRLQAAGLNGGDAGEALRGIPWRQRAILREIAPLCGVDFDDYVRRQQPYVTSAQVRNLLADGMDIGAHSIDHPRYADIPLEEQFRQTRTSMSELNTRFTLKHRAFAFPHSDRGVSRTFFETLFDDGTLEVSFGTAAPERDSVPRSFQRFTMEKSDLPASAIVARNHLRRLRLAVARRSVINRPSA